MTLLHPIHASIDLSGKWQFSLDPHQVGEKEGWAHRPLSDSINLPTTTDQAKKGSFVPPTDHTGGLTRLYPYEGWAWYSREIVIPASLKDRNVLLTLERTKATTVWIDGKESGKDRSLCAPQEFDLGRLSVGKHRLTIRVDNAKKNWPDRVVNSHMLEESTQTNWNGILGVISLRPVDDIWIRGVTVDQEKDRLRLTVRLSSKAESGGFTAILTDRQGRRQQFESTSGQFDIPRPSDLWDEYEQPLYHLSVRHGVDTWEGKISPRTFRAENGQFRINRRRAFLRGKHDACVFPLTGYPPMTTKGWERYFKICKSYGINHVRFHSWCPPEAAFDAADHIGIYLQPELPFWGDASKPGVEAFLTSEGIRILEAYGHHASFVMLGLGNEYWGGPDHRARIVKALRKFDPTRLYSQGSNTEAWKPQEFETDDYRVNAYASAGPNGDMRGSYGETKGTPAGYIQRGVVGTLHTYSSGLQGKRLPFVSHEIGQYEVYPRFDEIEKYTGALRPDNFEFFKQDLAKHGMAGMDWEFSFASGRLAAQCYREEIEAALRTPEFDGFQLLDLQDFPGQGTALVGMLDAFMDSKGLITPAEWRSFCSDLVPLALFPKFTWTTQEMFTAEIRIANYRPETVESPVRYELRQGDLLLAKGVVKGEIPSGTTSVLGRIEASLLKAHTPGTVDLTLSVAGRSLTWRIWVYGQPNDAIPSGVAVARTYEEALSALQAGHPTLFFPRTIRSGKSLPCYYTPDFWCYQMFHGMGSTQPGTNGFLIRNQHAALSEFPSESYSTWQWQSLALASKALILDDWPQVDFVVQTIDNYNRNHRLGTIFEAKVGQGKLLLCTIPLPDLGTPEARQLYASLLHYAGSNAFQPKHGVTTETLQATFAP